MALPSEAMLVATLNREQKIRLSHLSEFCLLNSSEKHPKSQGRISACIETAGQKPSKHVRAQVQLYLTRPNPRKQGLQMN